MSTCQHCGRTHAPAIDRCPATREPMNAPGLIGSRVDRYTVEALLGSGGFGAVYRARHVHTDALVALKLLKHDMGTDPQMVERFLREAKAAAAVGSEHIVRVSDAGVAGDGQAFLAMELLEGLDLAELSQREPLSTERLVGLLLQVLDGLAAAHAKGIVHRDMKPANVFVTHRTGDDGASHEFIKLLDFGISKMRTDDGGHGLTMTGVAMGTPTYMAPEQFFDARAVDGRADIYSVAAMAYELLSGRLPLEAQSYAEFILKVKSELPTPLLTLVPRLPATLAQAVTVGLAKEPQHRWQTAAEFARALRSASGLTRATPAPSPAPVSQPAPLLLSLEATRSPQRAPTTPPRVPPLTVIPGAAPAPMATGAPVPSSGPLPVTPGSAPPALEAPALPSIPVSSAALPPAPGVPAPVPASATPAPTSPLKWVLIIGGAIIVLGSCCLFGAVVVATQGG